MNKRELLKKFLEVKEEDCHGWCGTCEYVEICDTIERLWKRIQEKEKWEEKWEEWGEEEEMLV